MNQKNSANVPAPRAAIRAADLLRLEERGAVLHVRLDRPAKRNAINDALVAQLHTTSSTCRSPRVPWF
jgi:enoyl-CoA hydratase/carnithine racemase